MKEIPCITNANSNCPDNCPAHRFAVARLDDLAQQLSQRAGRIITPEEAVIFLREVINPADMLQYSAQGTKTLEEHGILNQCSHSNNAIREGRG